jgi:hypothetical protein
MDNNPCYLNDYYGGESQPSDGGYNKYSGAGNTTLILPEKAKILSRLNDYENDGKINYKGVVYEGKDGDIKEFSINGVKYSVKWGNDGSYKGYYNVKGERYINPNLESKSQKSQIPLGAIKKGPPKHPEFKSPKGGDRKVKNPNGSGTGWVDNNGDVWVPTDHNGTHAPHWDKQSPGGKNTNVYPNEEDYEEDASNSSSQSSPTLTPSTLQVATGVAIVVVSYEILKWGAAIMFAPITGGASLGAAALTP